MRFLRHLISLLIRLVGAKVAVVFLLVLGLAYLWGTYGRQPRPLPLVKRYVGQALVARALAQFPGAKELGRVLVVPLEGDWDGFFEESIRNAAIDRGLFEAVPAPVWRRLARDLGLAPSPAYDAAALAAIVQGMDAQWLLLGKVLNYEETDQAVFGELNVVLLGKEPSSLRTIHVSKTLHKSYVNSEYLTLALRLAGPGQRLVIWSLAVLFFPLLVCPLTMVVTARRHALWNLVLVACYTVVLVAVTLLVLGPAQSLWHGLLLVAGILLVALYMLASADFLAGIAREREWRR